MSEENPAQPAQPLPSPSTGAGFVPPSIDELNKAISQYEFVSLIGIGGMGAVYKARQSTLDRYVAIKILPPIPDDEMGFTERFRREAQAMAKLTHPHIVAVYDFGETDKGELFFVMEYVEGADLHQLIQKGDLTNKHFYSWIPQICSALQYAHSNNIIHRDIKPANILLDTSGRVKIADFGLAKRTGTNQQQTALTVANVSMGTPDYAAPEQLEGGKQVDWRADIYSVGVLMYQMLTGKVPRGAFPMPTEKVPELDPRIDDVVLKAIQSNPENRFQNADEISTQLTQISSTVPAPAKKAEKPMEVFGIDFSKRWIMATSAGIALLAVSTIAALFSLSQAKHERAALAAVESAKETEPKPIPKPPDPIPSATTTQVKAKPDPPKEKPPAKPKKKAASVEKSEKVPALPVKKVPTPPVKKEKAKEKNGKAVAPTPPETTEKPDPTRETHPRRGAGPRGGNLALFKSKLGTRLRPESVRRTASGLMLVRKDGVKLSDEPLARIPTDLKAVVKLVIGQGPRQASATSPFAMALHPDGKLTTWGDNSKGQLDLPETATDIVDIAAGIDHALALKSDGTVIAWGSAAAGQTEIPQDLENVTRLAAGQGFSVALLADGTVRAWGDTPQSQVPAGLAGVSAVATGYDHVLCLLENGAIATWGGNDFGQLDAPEIADAKAIACTYGSSLALQEDGRLVGWGTTRQKEFSTVGVIESLTASGDTVILRDEQKRLIAIPPRARMFPAFPFLRQLPVSAEIVFSDEIIFAYRPSRLKARNPDSEGSGIPDEFSPEEPPLDPMPDPQPRMETEAGLRIAELQIRFEEAYLEQVSQPFEESVAQLNDFYVNALDKKQAEAAEANRLEEAVALRSEGEQMRAAQPFPESDPPNLSFSLLDLRSKYRKEIAGYREARDTAETDLLEKYDKALQTLQDEFTQEQKLDEALEVKSFRERR